MNFLFRLLEIMADRELPAVVHKDIQEDPNKVAEEVVNNLKSQGLFDQFRKECLEELENLEAYRLLKQRVENHVASFLSKYKWSEKMSKNSLRDNLRMNINRSEVLLNGIDRLVDQILSSKIESFSDRIDPEIDKYLGIERENISVPGTGQDENKPEIDSVQKGISNSASSAPSNRGLNAAVSKQNEPSTSNTPMQASQSELKISNKTSSSDNKLSRDNAALLMKNQASETNTNNAKVAALGENKVINDSDNVEIPFTDSSVETKNSDVAPQVKIDLSISQSVSVPNGNSNDAETARGGAAQSTERSKQEKDYDTEKMNKYCVDKSLANSDSQISKQNREATKLSVTKLITPSSTTESEVPVIQKEETAKKRLKEDIIVDGKDKSADGKLELSDCKAIPEQVETGDLSSVMQIGTKEAHQEKKNSNELAQKEKVTSRLEKNVSHAAHVKMLAETACLKQNKEPDDFEEGRNGAQKQKENSRETTISKGNVNENLSGEDCKNIEKEKTGGRVESEAVNNEKATELDPSVVETMVEEIGDVRSRNTNLISGEGEEKNLDVEGNTQSVNRKNQSDTKNVLKKVENETYMYREGCQITSETIPKENLVEKKKVRSYKVEPDNKASGDVAAESKDDLENKDESREVHKKDGKDTENQKANQSDLSSENHDCDSENSVRPEESSSALSSDIEESSENESKSVDSFSGTSEQTSNKLVDESNSQESTNDSNFGFGQRKVKRRKRLISESEDDPASKVVKMCESRTSESEKEKMKPSLQHLSKSSPISDESKPKKVRGRLRKAEGSASASGDTLFASVSEEVAKSGNKSQEEIIGSVRIKRQRSMGSDSNASETCTEERELETRRTKRQIKPKRCYSPSEGK